MKRKNSLKNSRKRIIQATVAAVAGITVAVAAFRPVETSSKRSTAGGGKHRCTEDGNRR